MLVQNQSSSWGQATMSEADPNLVLIWEKKCRPQKFCFASLEANKTITILFSKVQITTAPNCVHVSPTCCACCDKHRSTSARYIPRAFCHVRASGREELKGPRFLRSTRPAVPVSAAADPAIAWTPVVEALRTYLTFLLCSGYKLWIHLYSEIRPKKALTPQGWSQQRLIWKKKV